MVSAATAMYINIYTTASNTILYLIYGTLNLRFGAWIGGWGAAGVLLGLYIGSILLKKVNR